MAIPILIISGFMGAMLYGLAGYAASGFVGSSCQLVGPGGLWTLGYGFVSGAGATLMWRFSGAGFSDPKDYVRDRRGRKRWSHAVFYSAALGAFLGFFVFVEANLPKPQFSLTLVVYVLAFVVAAEGAMVLGRGFNRLLARVA